MRRLLLLLSVCVVGAFRARPRHLLERWPGRDSAAPSAAPALAEPLGTDCALFPNQTLFEPHFFSCSSNGRLGAGVLSEHVLLGGGVGR